MITKHSDWELGAYLYEYNGDPFTGVSTSSPITLLSETFFSNCTKAYINKKFFYFDISKDTYYLKCDVQIMLRFFISLKTEINNTVHILTGYYPNPLQVKTKTIPETSFAVTANTQSNYKTINNIANIPNYIVDKNNSFYIGTTNTDSIALYNGINGFFWSLTLKQI